MRKIVLPEETWISAIKMYEEGATLTEAASSIGVTYDVLRMNFIQRGVPIRNVRECKQINRKYEYTRILHDMTNAGAYLLGWIASDGGIRKAGFRIVLKPADEDHVKYLRDLISPQSEVKPDGKGVGFYVCSAEIKELLQSYGVVEAKSYKDFDIDWSKFTKEQYSYFLLGLTEGDGSFAQSSVSLLMPSKMLDSVHRLVFSELGILDYSVYDASAHGLKHIKLTGSEFYTYLEYIYATTPDVKCLFRKYMTVKSNLYKVANSKSTYKHTALRVLQELKV